MAHVEEVDGRRDQGRHLRARGVRFRGRGEQLLGQRDDGLLVGEPPFRGDLLALRVEPGERSAAEERRGLSRGVDGVRDAATPSLRFGHEDQEASALLALRAAPERPAGVVGHGGVIVADQRLLGGLGEMDRGPLLQPAELEVARQGERLRSAAGLEPVAGATVRDRSVIVRPGPVRRLAEQGVAEDELGLIEEA